MKEEYNDYDNCNKHLLSFCQNIKAEYNIKNVEYEKFS